MKPISILYYYWGREIGLEAFGVAQALLEAGIIKLVGTEHYTETDSFKNMEFKDLNPIICAAIDAYLLKTFNETEPTGAKK